MTKVRRSKAEEGGGIGLALFAICFGIYNWVLGHTEIVIIIAVAVVSFIILLFIVKRLHIRRYWTWFYSRERGLNELGIQHLLQEETDNVLNKLTQNIQGCGDSDYAELSTACKRAYNSYEVYWLEGDSVKYSGERGNFSGEALASSINLQLDGELAAVYCKTSEEGGYTFVLLPNAIYAFITGASAYTFVGAYEKSILQLKVSQMYVQKTYNHITDMSHQPRGYFLKKYCDIHDSKPAAAGWRYETKDGYRDGRHQGNNDFIVKVIYSRVDFGFGNMSSSVAFSCTDSGDIMKEAFELYKRMADNKKLYENVEHQYVEEDILATVTKDVPQAVASNINDGNTQTTVLDAFTIKQGTISCEEARSRNRKIAKILQDRLNKEFTELQFKVFQIKKQRKDRNLQDASVYTYLPFNSSRYCLEYNVKTNLDSGVTVLEYILTAEDKVLQGDDCQLLISQNKMRKVGESYRTDFDFDYSNYTSTDAVDHMFAVIKTYVNKALENASKVH